MLAKLVIILAACILTLGVIHAIPTRADSTPTCTPTVWPSGECFRPLKGDFTNDGVVTIADTLGFVKDLARIDVIGIVCGMDINCDLKRDTVDLLQMLKYNAGLPYFEPQADHCAEIGYRQGPVSGRTYTPSPTPWAGPMSTASVLYF